MSGRADRDHVETIVVGAGQAGLSVGYHLSQLGRPFMILEANERVGDPWRRRWDSLRLFTPARFDGLDGLPFPAPPHYFPTKDEMAAYLEGYVDHFHLPVHTGTRVERLSRSGDVFLAETNRGSYTADNVVVAMSNFQRPKVPAFAGELDPSIVQLHSYEYRGPEQLRDGPLLIVGAGNSGAEIAMESIRSRPTLVAGRDTGHVPFRIEGLTARILLRPLFRVVFHRLLSVTTPLGRKVRPKVIKVGGPLVRVKPRDLTDAGVERVPRVAGVRDGLPLLADGRTANVTNVIWCTGFTPGFSWIDLPLEGEDEPLHDRGVVSAVPGLFFVGLHFLSAMSSVMIHGVGRDANYAAQRVAARGRRRAAGGAAKVAAGAT
jgi:putative flavoprotein involved in K+ transport